jgi:hypothetical protein
MTLQLLPSEFLKYEENFIFFYIGVVLLPVVLVHGIQDGAWALDVRSQHHHRTRQLFALVRSGLKPNS